MAHIYIYIHRHRYTYEYLWGILLECTFTYVSANGGDLALNHQQEGPNWI